MQESLKAAYELAVDARGKQQRFVRIEVQPKPRFMQRYVNLWDSVLGKTVGRRVVNEIHDCIQVPVVEMLIVEVGVADVIEAYRRERVRDVERIKGGPESIQANQFTRPKRVTTAR